MAYTHTYVLFSFWTTLFAVLEQLVWTTTPVCTSFTHCLDDRIPTWSALHTVSARTCKPLPLPLFLPRRFRLYLLPLPHTATHHLPCTHTPPVHISLPPPIILHFPTTAFCLLPLILSLPAHTYCLCCKFPLFYTTHTPLHTTVPLPHRIFVHCSFLHAFTGCLLWFAAFTVYAFAFSHTLPFTHHLYAISGSVAFVAFLLAFSVRCGVYLLSRSSLYIFYLRAVLPRSAYLPPSSFCAPPSCTMPWFTHIMPLRSLGLLPALRDMPRTDACLLLFTGFSHFCVPVAFACAGSFWCAHYR